MTWRVVRQPNDKLAVFSEGVDDFTVYDATREEVLRYCMRFHKMDRESAFEKVRAGVEDYIPFSLAKKGNGVARFEDALKSIAMTHGLDRVREVLVQFECPDHDVSHLDLEGLAADHEEDLRADGASPSPPSP